MPAHRGPYQRLISPLSLPCHTEALFDVYERYFVPLNEGLEPALKGFILALLPGLEEGSEFFTRYGACNRLADAIGLLLTHHRRRTMELLNNVCKRVDREVFFGHVWGSLLTTPSLRFFAATYLAHRLRALGQVEGHAYVLGKVCACAIKASTNGTS